MARDEVKGQEHKHAREQMLRKVFKTFSARWSKAFAASRADELLPVWMVGIEYLEIEGLESLAVRFAASGAKYPPSAEEFARYVRSQRGSSATSAPVERRSRVWEWASPITNRFSRAERTDNGEWIWHAIDDSAEFLEYDDRAKISYCEGMVMDYQQRLQQQTMLAGMA